MSTYNPIATQTLTGATSSIIFSNIPQSYTDLVVVINGALSGSGVKSINFNGDTASNYSCTTMIGAGSSYSSGRYAEPYIDVSNASANSFVNVIQINNYSNNTTFKNYLARQNAAVTSTETIVGLWRNTNPITTISFSASGGQTYASGTTFSIYAISAGSPKAQGGLVTKDSTYYYHTFLSSGVFTPNQALTCDYLVVAGGGGGGGGFRSGGGGAGGLRCTVGATGGGGTLESTLSLTAQNYSIIVGAGGSGATNANGFSGSNSVFSTITATGGGYGGGNWDSGNAGGAGGSGGGGIGSSSTGGAGGARTASPVQGFNGGSGYSGGLQCGGGGGGAGAIGQNGGSGGTDGDGGAGATTSISGTSVTYAGGGGGGNYGSGNVTIGGTGGGGAGGSGDNPYNNGVSGTANTGGGAGGASGNERSGGNGGSGIVIVRYAI